MPIYDYQCKRCGTEYHNISNRVADRRTNAPVCCDEHAEIVIRPPKDTWVQFFEDYQCPVTGQHVTSMRQRKRIMAEHNLVEQKQIKSGEW